MKDKKWVNVPYKVINRIEYVNDYKIPDEKLRVVYSCDTSDAINEKTGKLIKMFVRNNHIEIIDKNWATLYETDSPYRIRGDRYCVDWEERVIKRKVRKYGHKNETPGIEYKEVPRTYSVVTIEKFDEIICNDKVFVGGWTD